MCWICTFSLLHTVTSGTQPNTTTFHLNIPSIPLHALSGQFNDICSYYSADMYDTASHIIANGFDFFMKCVV